MKKSFTIHDLPKEERPRERLEKFGPEALSAQELLALILGRGINGESVMVTSQKILSRFGSLESLQDASIEDLKELKGLGIAKAAQIKACIEISRRINNVANNQITRNKKQRIFSPQDAHQQVKSKIKDYAKEHFLVLSYDTRNRLLGIDIVSIGTLNSNLVHPRETFEAAIRRHAAQIIIAHNHPSGDVSPSREDEQITKQLINAGRILGIFVLDHIIVSINNYFSFSSVKPHLFINKKEG